MFPASFHLHRYPWGLLKKIIGPHIIQSRQVILCGWVKTTDPKSARWREALVPEIGVVSHDDGGVED